MIRRASRPLLLTLAVALLLPAGGVEASQHCNSPISFLSGTGLLLNPRVVGCDVIAEDLPGTPWDESNSDWIVPNAAQGVVRWNEGGTPAEDGTRLEDGTIVGSRIEINWGEDQPLRFERGTDIATGEPANFWDSQPITIGRQASLTAVAVITVCRDEDGLFCDSVTYRGIAAYFTGD